MHRPAASARSTGIGAPASFRPVVNAGGIGLKSSDHISLILPTNLAQTPLARNVLNTLNQINLQCNLIRYRPVLSCHVLCDLISHRLFHPFPDHSHFSDKLSHFTRMYCLQPREQ